MIGRSVKVVCCIAALLVLVAVPAQGPHKKEMPLNLEVVGFGN